MSRYSLVQQAHALIAEVLQPGDCAIDATLGNGHDTLFLARCVGLGGKVFGFDIQQAALDATWQRLDEAGLSAALSLYHAGHELLHMLVPEPYHGRVRAVMFNLGYLPGGDKLHITHIPTTLAALNGAAQLLQEGGRISVLAYTGHAGGREEAESVKAWARALSPVSFSVRIETLPGTSTSAPELILIERLQR